MPAKKRTIIKSGPSPSLPEIPVMSESEFLTLSAEFDRRLLEESSLHARENYNPFPYYPWWFIAGEIKRPVWTNSQVCWGTQGVTRKNIHWRASVLGSSDGGCMRVSSITHLLGNEDFPGIPGLPPTAPRPGPKQDGELKATWNENGNILIRVGLNQKRLLATKWKLSENYEAMALDLSNWTPDFDPPGKRERQLLELQALSEKFLMKQYLRPRGEGTQVQSVGKKHDGYRAKFKLLRDREFVARSRDLQEDTWENAFIRAVGAAFADNVIGCKLAPPTQGEVKWKMAEMFPKHSQGKTDGAWSKIFNRLGFGWL